MDYKPEVDIGSPNEAQKKRQGKRDFWMGFIFSIVLNGLYAAVLAAVTFGYINNLYESIGRSAEYEEPLFIILNILPWLGNIAALVFFALKKRSGIVLGILASYGAALGLALVAGIILAAPCFISLTSN